MIKRLFIMEKKLTADALAEGLGQTLRQDGYYQCGSDAVTWCFGHMLALCDPEDYDPKYKQWDAAHLPLHFIPWKYKTIPDKECQLNKILSLITQAEIIVHGGDMDDEGQLLIEEVLEYAQATQPIQRILLNDLSPKPVQQALSSIEDNRKHSGVYQKTLARSVADQLYGYNMTRAYTLAGQASGMKGVLSVGRVQSAILGMVVRKDMNHEAHQSSGYYSLSGKFIFDGLTITARFKPDISTPTDDKDRIINSNWAQSVAGSCTLNPASITDIETNIIKTPAPLPFNLLTLQAECSKKYKMNPSTTKKVTQSLRDKFKLITYNRTNVEHLHEEKHAEAPAVLHAITQTAQNLSSACENADTSIMSIAFNSKIVAGGAHHGIIPTESIANFDDLSDNERKVYMLIARAYIAQFYPVKEHEETKVTITCAGYFFVASSKRTMIKGWETLYDDKVEKKSENADLKGLELSSTGKCKVATAAKKTTKAPVRYTMDTLLVDLSKAAKYIEDEELKKVLMDKDKNIKGERGGIGTPATRDDMINKLIAREFIIEDDKWIKATEKGKTFHDLLPSEITSPDITAKWYQRQSLIENGDLTLDSFLKDEIIPFLTKHIQVISKEGLDIDVKPSEKMMSLVKSIAEINNVSIDTITTFRQAKLFIGQNQEIVNQLKEEYAKPTEKMVSYVLKICAELDMEAPEGLNDSREICSSFIDEHQGNLKPLLPSEKQLSLAEKIAKAMKEELPEDCKSSMKECSSFIDANISKLPKRKKGKWKKSKSTKRRV